MKSSLITVLAAGLVVAAPAYSATVTIDFEGPTSFASVDQFYSGGTDGAGAPGPNLGVSFGLDALALQNDAAGPYFSNAPSPLGVMAPVGANAAMNVAAGFSGSASFSYSSTRQTEVGVWSGVDGTGSLLGSFSLGSNATSGCSDSPFCNWSLATLAFSGIAKSITFGDAASVAGFDNVTITAVPEPATALLLPLGAALAFGLATRRRRTH